MWAMFQSAPAAPAVLAATATRTAPTTATAARTRDDRHETLTAPWCPASPAMSRRAPVVPYRAAVAVDEAHPGPAARPAAAPRLPDALAPVPDDDLDPEFPDLDGLGLDGTTVSYPAARSLGLMRSRLTDCHLDVPADAALEVQDAELVELDLTGRRIESMLRVTMRRCRLGGADLGDARLRDVTLEGCVLDLASVRNAELERVAIRECRGSGLDLSGARLTDVTVADLDLGEVTLDGARLQDVDVTGADLRGVTDLRALRGAIISEVQAVSLARRLAEAAGLQVARPVG